VIELSNLNQEENTFMTRLQFARLALLVVILAAFTTALRAQQGEVYIFGGGYWPGNEVFDEDNIPGVKMPGGGTYGAKVGGFLSPNFQLDGNLSWYNHFGLSRRDSLIDVVMPGTILLEPEVRSLLWEGSGTWHFTERTVGVRFTPYVTLGLGGMTARIKDADSVFVTGGGFIPNPLYRNPASPVPQFIANPARRIVMDDNDTFFTFSYGGGFKAIRAWGPAGFRVDFRGRTIPNFFSQGMTYPELTGGLIFDWGER
jgi:hypothetical protein